MAFTALVATTLLLMPKPLAAAAPTPFSTFLQENASISGIGHDASGNIFIVGTANDSPIPGHGVDIFAARLDPSATKVAYFVYLGGSGADSAQALAVDPQGNAYITGSTSSSDFPVTSGFSGPVPSNTLCPFAMKLDPNGAVVYATFFAGAVFGYGQAIAADSGGNVIISGGTHAEGVFVTKLDASGTKTLFSLTNVGGNHIALGPQGDIWISGSTTSTSYPTTPGAFQTTFTPSFSCGPEGMCVPSFQQYVTRISADGTKLVFSTFITGTNGATNFGLAVDGSGNAYVTGTGAYAPTGAPTQLSGYPFSVPATAADRTGLFLTKLDPTGSKVLWSVRQGGNLVALDAGGNPVVGGSFVPVTGTAYSPPGSIFPPPPPTGNTPAACLPNGLTVQSIAYVQSFSAQDGSTTVTRLLSATQATASAMAVEPDGRILLAGSTLFPDVPLTPGVVFSDAVATRTAPGAFLAAFDMTQPAASQQLACVTDSATFWQVGPVAPGQLLSLFGNGLGPLTGVSGMAPGQTTAPTSLANVQITFDGFPAPLLYVSSSQINVQVPFAVSHQASTVMTVSIRPDAASAYAPVAARMFAITPSSPSLFLDLSVMPMNCSAVPAGAFVFLAVALNSDGSRNGCGNPAKPGSTVTVFVNGVPTPLSTQVRVWGGASSLAAGPLVPAPGTIAGVYQLPIQLPGTTAAGLQGVMLDVEITGIPAGPLIYSNTIYQQTAALVWMKQ